jgi:predicted Rossmann-fold nucleotide-binding protein
MTTRYLICGGRHFTDYDAVHRVLRALILHPERAVVIQGGGRGIDALAATWAKTNRVPEVITVRAQWEKFGSAAGPIRNRKMLEEQKPDVVIAFPGGPGTADMVRQARGAEVVVVEVAL